MKRSYKALLAAALVLAAGSFTLSALLFSRLADTTTRTNSALCTFRADVQQRLHNGEAFLREHPRGIPGVPMGSLRQSFEGQRRTVRALRGLDCRSSR